jgi:hypothetical protein
LFGSRLLCGESHLLDLRLGGLVSRHGGYDASECRIDQILVLLLGGFMVEVEAVNLRRERKRRGRRGTRQRKYVSGALLRPHALS